MRIPLVAYTGDTSPAGLDACPACFEAKILITEMSFIRASHRRDKIHKFGHMHLDDFVERAERFKNELIVGGALQHALPPERGAETAGQQAARRAESEDEAVGVSGDLCDVADVNAPTHERVADALAVFVALKRAGREPE